jgi:hypothetical protein
MCEVYKIDMDLYTIYGRLLENDYFTYISICYANIEKSGINITMLQTIVAISYFPF